MNARPKSQLQSPPTVEAARPIDNLNSRTLGLAGLLIGLTLLAYWPAYTAGFVWDDDSYIIENMSLRQPDGLIDIWLNPRATPQYYPLVFTTFWLEFQAWGLRPLGYHVNNVLLQILCALLLWRLLARLNLPGAWLVATIFAVHPVEVESVTWVTERKNVLSLALAMGSMLCYMRFAPIEPSETQESNFNARRGWWYAAGLTLFVLGLFSKTAIVALPAVLLVLIWWKRGKIRIADVAPLVPFFIAAICMGLLTAWLERNYVGALGAEFSHSPAERLLIAGRALWFYAGKVFWPYPLIHIYPRWDVQTVAWWQWLFPISALALIGALWLLRGRIGRGPLAAVLIFAGVLFPALGFFNIYYMRYSYVADHFQYHASVALIVLSGAGLGRMTQAAQPRTRNGALVASAALLLALAGLTYEHSTDYSDLEHFYRVIVEKNPHAWMASRNLTSFLVAANRTDEALGVVQRAIEIEPNRAETRDVLGVVYLQSANASSDKAQLLERALKEFGTARELDPTNPDVMVHLGLTLVEANRSAEASPLFLEALERNPNEATSLAAMGSILWDAGRRDEAVDYLQRAGEANSATAEGQFALGLVAVAMEEWDDAAQHLEASLKLKANSARAHFELATIRARQQQLDEAAKHYQEAIRLRPSFMPTRIQLASVLVQLGENDQAIEQLDAALAQDPKSVDALVGLGVAHTAGNPAEAIQHFERAIQLDPNRADVHYALANLLFARQDFQRAADSYGATVRLRPSDARARNNLGIALINLGNVDAAIQQFEQAVQLQPDYAEATKNLERARALPRETPRKDP